MNKYILKCKLNNKDKKELKKIYNDVFGIEPSEINEEMVVFNIDKLKVNNMILFEDCCGKYAGIVTHISKFIMKVKDVSNGVQSVISPNLIKEEFVIIKEVYNE